MGTASLLEACRATWSDQLDQKRFICVSTDEVFGSLAPSDPAFCPASPLRPRSPYSASKAGAGLLADAWRSTFGLPTVVTHCSNNYGPRQHFEKFIPNALSRLLAGKPVRVYGSGQHVRDWLHVLDHAEGLVAAARFAEPGERVLFGGRTERSNLEVAEILVRWMQRLGRLGPGEWVETGKVDRPGHDFRYAVDPSEAERKLGWRASRVDFEVELGRLVEAALRDRYREEEASV